MADLSVVLEKLQGFETADDLAEFFRGYGIQAQPRNSRSCAITKFVMEETGLSGVKTSGSSVQIYVDECGFERTTEYFDHSAAMQRFVENYDRGLYPDLVEAGYEIYEAIGCTCCKD